MGAYVAQDAGCPQLAESVNLEPRPGLPFPADGAGIRGRRGGQVQFGAVQQGDARIRGGVFAERDGPVDPCRGMFAVSVQRRQREAGGQQRKLQPAAPDL